MDLVRSLYRAVNRADADAVASHYHPICTLEQVFDGDAGVYEGREIAREKWRTEFDRHAGALAGGHRIEVDRIAGIETGWGWVRAEWVSALRSAGAAGERVRAGYSDFWIEDGLIRRHRSVARSGDDAGRRARVAMGDPPVVAPAAAEPGRRYPTRPMVGVGAVVLTDDGRVVLVKRRHEPLAGQWSLPGGMLEIGESLESGTAREIREETGLVVDVGGVVDVFDRILLDDTGRVQYHFVLIDYLCRPRGGTLQSGSDVDDVALADPRALERYRLTEKARDVVGRALEMTT